MWMRIGKSVGFKLLGVAEKGFALGIGFFLAKEVLKPMFDKCVRVLHKDFNTDDKYKRPEIRR